MEPKNEQSAFPSTKPLDGWGDPEKGMTLRDYLASSAMQGIISNCNIFGKKTMYNDDISSLAYSIADEMLKQREL